MFEIWKDIDGFVGKYQVSNYGRVKSLARLRKSKGGCLCPVKERILKPKVDDDGYLSCGLSIGIHKKMKFIRINVLVYQTFIGEITNGYDVHHKDHNKLNNFVENLCLIEHKKHSDLHSKDKSKPIVQYTLDGQFVAEYKSAFDASRQTGFNRESINKCCLGKQKTCANHLWCFKGKEYEIENKVLKAQTRKTSGIIRQVVQLNKEGQLVNIFNSIVDAYDKTGIPKSNISYCCKGKLKTAGGYIWKYLTDFEQLTAA